MSKFFTRQDVQQLNRKLIEQGVSSVASLSEASRKVVRDSKLSREEINLTFSEARRKLVGSR